MKDIKLKPLDLNNLSIEQKIGQMLLCRKPFGDSDRKSIVKMVSEKRLGGIHLPSVEGANSEILEAAEYPLLVGDNMEYGFGSSRGEVGDICPLAIGAVDCEETAYEWARLTAIQAKAKGYNLVFGPLFDLAINPKSCCLGPRTFGADKGLVARMSVAAVRGFQDNGMVCTGKHYPGFGESKVDSHIGMVYLNCDEDALVERELYPYRQAIEKADLSAIMVGHIMVPSIDPDYPATVSKILVDLIRSLGFEGLLMSDSLAMVGMTNMFGLADCHGMAMAAGMDMVMTSYRIGAEKAFEYMLKAYEQGKICEHQIDAAVARVIAAQNRTLIEPDQKDLWQQDKGFCLNAARNSITAVLNDGEKASVPTESKHLFIIQTKNSFDDGRNEEYSHEGRDVSETVSQVTMNFSKSDIEFIPEFPSRYQMETLLIKTMNYDSIIFILYNRTVAYMGSSELTGRIISLIEGLAHKISALVLFGNPYAARQLPKVPRLIFGYEGCCQDVAVFDVLTGTAEHNGKLPINILIKE